MKNLLKIIALAFFCTQDLSAQQQSQYTQYMYNTMTINPGYTGTRGIPSIFGFYRSQWAGLDGAPKTANFSIESPVSSNGQGLGLSVLNDKIGPASTTNVAVSFSYPVPLSRDITMSFGVSASGDFMEVDFNKLNVHDGSDPSLTGKVSKVSPNLGAGVYFYSQQWYLGLSVPQLLETKFYDDVKVSVASQRMHFYAIAGYVFDLSDELKFKPAAMIKAVNGAPLAVDLSANMLFNEKFSVGVAYRWDAAVSAMAGFQVGEGINIGYAYDYDTQKIGNYNSGSHEVFLRFDLFNSSKYRLVMPRFF